MSTLYTKEGVIKMNNLEILTIKVIIFFKEKILNTKKG